MEAYIKVLQDQARVANEILGTFEQKIGKTPTDGPSVISFWLILFLRYTTNELLEYCPDSRLSTPLRFLWNPLWSGTTSF